MTTFTDEYGSDMLKAFPYMHSSANGEEHIAGWGIWHDGWEDAFMSDGFSSEEQAQAAIEVFTSSPDLMDWGREALSVDWFMSMFGHPWAKAPCPEDCIICARELT